VPRVTANIGTRYVRKPSVIIPYFVQIPGTFNLGNGPPSNQATYFLQGAATVDVWRNLVLRGKTNYDLRTTSVVETRFGGDFKFDCWSLSLEYVRRNPDRPGKSPDNEFRFSLSLLGIGNVLSTHVGATDSDSRFK
jgi:lipopolysaccharide assembly outer membrane protein LptD (OstA)